MKKIISSGLSLVLLSVFNGNISKAQTVSSCKLGSAVISTITDELKGAVEDASQRTPYSTTWITSSGKTIIQYSSQVINRADATGKQYHNAVDTGAKSSWGGGTTPSCLYPNFNTDSILVTVPAGMKVTSFIVDYFYETNPSIPIPLSDGIFYFSTLCGKTDTVGCIKNLPGYCYLDTNFNDLSTPLTTCIAPNCSNSQSFWLDAHLARYHGGSGCDTNWVWYSGFEQLHQYIFSAYVVGSSPIIVTKLLTEQNGPCNGSAAVTPSGGTAPYTYLWSPNSETTDSIDGLCAGTYCCSITDSKGCRDSVCFQIENTTGIHTITNAPAISIYPNPFTNTTTITISSNGQHYLEVDDVTGRKLQWVEFTGTQYQLSAQGLAKGIYFIRAFNSDNTVIGTGKIVIQ